MASGPNPIEIYQAALAQLRPILATGSASPDSSTPCVEWNIQSLVNHAISVQNFAFTVLGPGTPDPASMGNVDHPFPSEGAEAGAAGGPSELASRSPGDGVDGAVEAVRLAVVLESQLGVQEDLSRDADKLLSLAQVGTQPQSGGL